MSFDQEDLFESDSLSPVSERALNDVALSIGYSMMVLLFVLVSSMTALQNVAVNLPEAERTSAEKDDSSGSQSAVVVLTLIADANGGLQQVLSDDLPIDLNESLEARLAEQYGEHLAGASSVWLEVRADRRLSHGVVTEVRDRLRRVLQEFGGTPRQVSIRYTAKQTD